jgi:myosin heavy subunit
MLEAIRIRKAGFAIRIECEEFFKRYRACLKGEAAKYKDKIPREGCEAILASVFDGVAKMTSKT